MVTLNRMLSMMAFLYIVWHMITNGIGLLNVSLAILFFFSLYMEYRRTKREKEAEVEKKEKQARKQERKAEKKNNL